jgi:hypothetical protein
MGGTCDESLISEARVDDLDVDNDTDAATWDARMDAWPSDGSGRHGSDWNRWA